jgi:energy-coupling factor transporter ATP-binding protein EcfA2
MPQAIKAIRLKRFRKFKDNDLIASDHNILVGANNSGKTSILHALRLFFFAASGAFSGAAGKVKFHKRYIRLDEILPVSDPGELWSDCVKGNTKAKGVIVEVEFQSGLAVEISFTYRFGQVHVDAGIPKNPNRLSGKDINDLLKHKIAFIPGLVGILPQEPYVTPARRSAMSIEARYSEMYRSSLLHLDTTDKKALKRINKVLSKHLGVEITQIKFDPDKDVFVDVEYSQDGVCLDLSNAGSGMLQVIQVLVYIYLHQPTLLLIDEPDAHLHPELQEKLGNILKDVTKEMGAQLFVATHSPDVIDSFDPKEVYFIGADKKHFRPFKEDNAYVEGLVQSGIVTNSALSRIAVRPRCLVVEDSKIGILRKIDEVCDFGLFEFASDYKKAEGVSKFQTIHQIYLTIQDVVGKKIALFFLQDSDGLPDRYLQYIRDKYRTKSLEVHILERHEIESYLLDAKIVRAALCAKGHEMSLADMRKVLVKAAKQIKHQARGDIRRKALDVNRFCGKPEQFDENAVEADVDQWFDALELKEATILKVFPGKELMTAVREILQDETGIDLRLSDLMQAITPPRIASDLTKALKAIAEAHNT